MNNVELKELLDAKFTGLKAEVMASHEIQMAELQLIKSKQDFTNGRVNRHDIQINGLDRMQSEIVKNQAHIRWIKGNPIKAFLYAVAASILLIEISKLIPLEKILPYIK
jgi:hypothetical protein